MCLGLHTNGGAKSAEWWSELGRILPQGKGYVRFGIDGLETTNHLYRRNTKWDTVMRNVKAFIAAGGNAEWDFLVFRHNEHQVSDARALAKELGFTLFNVKASARFFDLSRSQAIDRTPVKDRKGNVEYWLERPSNPHWNNQALLNVKSNSRWYGGMLGYLDKTGISCKAAKEQSISISSEGYVLPCCWFGGEVLKKHSPKDDPFATLVKMVGGWDEINAKKRSIKEIVEGPFYSELLPSSWSRPSLAKGKIFTCAIVCGNDSALDMRGQQWKRQDHLD
jgi:MoaA/NifB/PqqE/SkfB family radical SAM enzyme